MAEAGGHIAFDRGAQHVLQLDVVLPLDRVVETLQRRGEVFVTHDRLRGLEDARVAGAGGGLADEQLLIELLAAPQPHKFDGDVPFGVGLLAHLEPGEMDHGAGEVGDLHRGAHVEHEHLAARGHGAGLNHELGGLGDRHEVADDLRVGDGDRPAMLDLAAEALDHRARGIEHVAEPDHGEQGGASALLRQRLEDQLGQALAGAHDIGGPDRLVARHEHEALHAQLPGGLGQNQRAKGVVLQAGEGVQLDDRHMLIGGGVIDHLDLEVADGAGHDLAVEHRSQHRNDSRHGGAVGSGLELSPTLVLLDFHLDLVKRNLRQLEQDQRLGSEAEQLPGELRPDRAPGAGDHHHLVMHMGEQQTVVGRHRIASEQVLDLDRSEIAHLDAARRDLGQRRQRLHHHGEGLQRPDGGAALATKRRRHGEHHFLHALLLDHIADLAGPEHLDPVHHLAGERGIGVDEGDELVLARLI